MRKFIWISLVISCQTILAQSVEREIDLYGMVGYSFSTLDFNVENNPYITDRSKSSSYSSPIFGFGLIAFGSKSEPGFRLVSDIQFSRLATSIEAIETVSATYTKYESIDLHYFRSKFTVGTRYFLLSGKLRPTVGAGFAFNFYSGGKANIYQFRDHTNIPDETFDLDGKLTGFRMGQPYLATGFQVNLSQKWKGVLEFRADFLGNNTNSVVQFDGGDLLQHRSVNTNALSILALIVF